MRIFTASIIIGSFMLIGALPAAAGQSTPALDSTAPIRLAAARDPSGARDTYTAAEKDLQKAWTKADTASHELQTVGAEGWKRAKITFETAFRKLAGAWDKVRPEDK